MSRLESVELGQILPVEPVFSSRQQDWQGILVERYRHEAGETRAPLLANHLVTLNLSRSYRLTQKIFSRTYEFAMPPDSFVLTAAEQEAFWRWDKPVEALHLQIKPSFLETMEDELGETRNNPVELLPRMSGSDADIEFFGKRLLLEMETENFGTRLYVESLINLLAVHLLRRYSTVGEIECKTNKGGLAPRVLRLLIEYINDNLQQEISLGELSALTGLSQFHFARAFQQSAGLPPHQFLIKCRVERAKCLLKENKFAVADIALLCGFSNQSHLNRHFKRFVGITPKQYLGH